jgi:hypothetical protein
MSESASVSNLETLHRNPAEVDDDTESYFSVFYPEPTDAEMLAAYATYRQGGGDPYEPYESWLIAGRAGQPETGGRPDASEPRRARQT